MRAFRIENLGCIVPTFVSTCAPPAALGQVMGRQKLRPRRIIRKSTKGEIRGHVGKASLQPSEYPRTEIFTSTSGVRGEILRVGCRAGGFEGGLRWDGKERFTHVVLLPGNPGVIEYYRPFLRRWFERLPKDVQERVCLHGVGLPGHDLRELNGERSFGIEDHLDYCGEYLGSEVVKPGLGESEIVMVGHSYGCFLGVEVMRRLEIEERAGFVMMMPCMDRMGDCMGERERWLVRDLGGIVTGGGWIMTKVMPDVVKEWLVERSGHDRGVREVGRRLVDGRRWGVYLNVCRLAREEMVRIGDVGKRMTGGWGERALLVWAEEDRWCGKKSRERICEAMGGRITVEWAGEGVRHAFVLEAEETERVVRIVAPWLSERVRGRGGKSKTGEISKD